MNRFLKVNEKQRIQYIYIDAKIRNLMFEQQKDKLCKYTPTLDLFEIHFHYSRSTR